MKQLIELLGERLVLPTDTGYDEARKVYNAMIDKLPAAIAYCKEAHEVIICVNYARDNHQLLTVRSGGHNAGGLGIFDDALVIDLSLMKDIKVNAAANTVYVQAGCLLKELDEATHAFGLAVPTGMIGTTGVAGLTLGGGIGHLTRQYGLTIDNLLEAEVVLANGELVKASNIENTDLYWALRGGGGNFGVVLSFVFALQPVHTVYAGPMLWDMEHAEEILRWYQDFIIDAPYNITGFFAFLTVPPAEMFPAELRLKKMCGIFWSYNGNIEEAEEVFKPIRAFKTPALDFVSHMPFPVLQTLFDAVYPPGHQWYWKADFVKELNNEAIALHIEYGNQLPTPLSTMHLYPVNGAAGRVSKTDTPWNYRDATWGMVIVGVDPDPANKDICIEWTRSYWEALHPYSQGGAYVNMMMEEGDERVKASYGDNYKRLAQIKAKYDPQNLFRINQNIKPAMVTTAVEI